MATMPWLRLYNEMRTDAKIKRIARLTGQSRFFLVGVWVNILILANESPERGKLLISSDIPMTLDDILDELGIEADTLQIIWDSFINLGMIAINEETYEITNWNKRQFASDDPRERVKKHRAKKKETLQNVTSNVTEALPKRYSNVVDSDSDSDSDSESNINDEAELDKKWGSIFSLYSNNINASESPLTIEEMMSGDYLGLPFDWWQQAIKIAGDRNVRKWSYVRGILNKSIKKGVSPDIISEEMKNGNSKQGETGTSIDSGLLGKFGSGEINRDAASPVDW